MADTKMKGRSWIFGDIMDVDYEIMPFDIYHELKGQEIPINEDTVGKYAMIRVDPDFTKKVKKGDFIVAGENMGYGHDHERASMAIKGAGVAAVICESTNANFMRNSAWLGLPVVECPGVKKKVKQGDELEVDLAAGTIKNLTTGAALTFDSYPDFLLDIIKSGGLYQQLKKEVAAGKV